MRADSRGRSRAGGLPRDSVPNGTADCSIEVGKTMSKPMTLAPPSMIALSTLAISGVHVTLGLPAKGRVLKVSSSSATTTVGDDWGECRSPKTRQRSIVRRSIDQPRNPSNAGEAANRPVQSAMTAPTAAVRRRTGSMDAQMPEAAIRSATDGWRSAPGRIARWRRCGTARSGRRGSPCKLRRGSG